MARSIVCPHCHATVKLQMEGDRLVAEVEKTPAAKPEDDLESYIMGDDLRDESDES